MEPGRAGFRPSRRSHFAGLGVFGAEEASRLGSSRVSRRWHAPRACKCLFMGPRHCALDSSTMSSPVEPDVSEFAAVVFGDCRAPVMTK